jgi:hypothetical protein
MSSMWNCSQRRKNLHSDRKISVVEYYKSFKSIQGIFAATCGLLPPASNFVLPGRIFPPLGNETVASQAFVVLLSLAVTYLVYLCQASTKAALQRAMWVCFALAAASFCLYFGVHLRFVRSIDVPSTHGELNVSVGYDRTNFANETFGTASDWEMLRYRGTDDEEIMKLWTSGSIYIVRLALLLSYLGLILSLIAFASLGVLLHVRNSSDSSP